MDNNKLVKDVNTELKSDNRTQSLQYKMSSPNVIKRRQEAYENRVKSAEFQRKLSLPHHEYNGDEQQYSDKIGSFSKALPHNNNGLVDTNAYNAYLRALSTGQTEDFEAIPMGSKAKLTNPQAAFAFDLIGADSHHYSTPNAPAFSSAWNAAEMAELYWHALTRDIPFAEYGSHPLIAEAASDLSKFTDYRGPLIDRKVTSNVLFRGTTVGDLTGPFISQFLLTDIPYVGEKFPQKYHGLLKGLDYLTNYEDWLSNQNGLEPKSAPKYETNSVYIRNERDLATIVHRDVSYEFYLTACATLLQLPKDALDRANPYLNSSTQSGAITFGGPHIFDLVAKAGRMAFEAVWFQKFLVHRRKRPEAYAGDVHLHVIGKKDAPIHPDLLNSRVVSEVFKKYGNYLLPMAYPEGCPIHPSYPGGHATVAGACVTILKAFFNEFYTLPNPVVPSKDGLSLQPYTEAPLTIGGELNKLASNIAFGRNMAGLHWRSDGSEGMRLGELVAIRLLQDYASCYNENFSGFTLTQFDGTTITI